MVTTRRPNPPSPEKGCSEDDQFEDALSEHLMEERELAPAPAESDDHMKDINPASSPAQPIQHRPFPSDYAGVSAVDDDKYADAEEDHMENLEQSQQKATSPHNKEITNLYSNDQEDIEASCETKQKEEAIDQNDPQLQGDSAVEEKQGTEVQVGSSVEGKGDDSSPAGGGGQREATNSDTEPTNEEKAGQSNQVSPKDPTVEPVARNSLQDATDQYVDQRAGEEPKEKELNGQEPSSDPENSTPGANNTEGQDGADVEMEDLDTNTEEGASDAPNKPSPEQELGDGVVDQTTEPKVDPQPMEVDDVPAKDQPQEETFYTPESNGDHNMEEVPGQTETSEKVEHNEVQVTKKLPQDQDSEMTNPSGDTLETTNANQGAEDEKPQPTVVAQSESTKEKKDLASSADPKKTEGNAETKEPLAAEDEPDEFGEAILAFRQGRKRKKPTEIKKISILLPSLGNETNLEPTTPIVKSTRNDLSNVSEEIEAELEDSLMFFGETHEDQDPAFIEYTKRQEEKETYQSLAELEAEEKAARQRIEELIASQIKEKQAVTDTNLGKYRARAAADEKRDMNRLLLRYKEQVVSSQNKIDQGVKMLRRRHNQEVQKAMQAHRQQAQQRGIPEQMASMEWSNQLRQLQTEQQRQLQKFGAKGEEVKKKCELEFKREKEKLRKLYEKRSHEIENSRQKVYARIFAGFQQLKQRYVKRQVQKTLKKRELLMQKHSETKKNEADKLPTQRENILNQKEERIELRQPSPIKLTTDWAGEAKRSGAALRHKHRKGILSQISKQLSVEIHNEGLWIYTITENCGSNDEGGKGKSVNKSNDERSKKSSSPEDHEFISWGVRARSVLLSIVCGVIPDGYGSDRFDFGDALAHQGQHIRCVVTDLRTSEETASAQRAVAFREQEEDGIRDLEKKHAEASQVADEAEKALKSAQADEKEHMLALDAAIKEFEKSRKVQHDFNTKFSRYLGPDGTPLPTTNPQDRQELTKAMLRYKSNFDTAERREKGVRKSLAEAKAKTQKRLSILKQAQRAVTVTAGLIKKKKALQGEQTSRGGRQHKTSEAAETERAANRVKDVIGALRKTAEKRREQLSQKRSSGTWIQSLPGLPVPLKKSLWHKMHRRRQQIVLRPSTESLVLGLRKDVMATLEGLGRSPQKDNMRKLESTELELQRAEQLFLLATHPVAPVGGLSSVPLSGSSNGQWAEPGWHLVLDVPDDDNGDPDSLLPRAKTFPVFEEALSEISSTPGGQAASMIQDRHLRALGSHLSAVAVATSLAETTPSLSSSVLYSEGDPFHVSEEAMASGYAFSLKSTASKQSSQQRKKTKEAEHSNDLPAAPSSGSKQHNEEGKKNPESASSTASSTSARRMSRTERKRKNSKTSGSDAPPRVQRRKSESSSATSNSADLAAQQRNQQYMQQQASDAAMQNRGMYNRQPSAQSLEQKATAQYNQFMKSQMSPSNSSTALAQQQQAGLQMLQQRQPQQHQSQQPFPSPQRQMNQLRMMSQSSQSPQAGRPTQMQAFPNPAQRSMQQMQPQMSQQMQPQMSQQMQMQQMNQMQQQMQMQQQNMPHMSQFFTPLPQPTPQTFQPMPMGRVGPPRVMGGVQQPGPGSGRPPQQGGQDDSSSDPLFMLKDF